MAETQGKFVWYELMTSDAKAAEAFYTHVVGWTAKPAPMPGVEYTLLNVGEAMLAGMMAMPERVREAGGQPGWIGYVAANDVDAVAGQAKDLGGGVHHEPQDIPGVGRFAVLSDPSGAMFAVMKWADPTGDSTPSMTPGHTGWHELYGGDVEGSLGFYSKLFGWQKLETMDMGPMGPYQIFGLGGQMIGGMMKKPDNVPAPFWTYYFIVDDIDAAVERVKRGGGQVVHGPQEVPGGGFIIQGVDPQGAFFALTGPRTTQ